MVFEALDFIDDDGFKWKVRIKELDNVLCEFSVDKVDLWLVRVDGLIAFDTFFL